MDLLDKSYNLVLAGFSKKKQREVLGLTCCGTECAACDYYKSMCKGCNETSGKVFHTASGQSCSIYQCCVGKNKFSTCAECKKIPCEIWQATKDPGLSQEAFVASIQERVSRLKK